MTTSRDGGAAAVELALCLGLLVSVGLIVAPLPLALAQQTRLEQAASYSARYLSSVPGAVRTDPTVLEDVASEAFGDRVVAVPTEVPQTRCATRKAVSVTLTSTRPLGPLGALAGKPDIDLIATASSCKE